jgi:hypothetical protein
MPRRIRIDFDFRGDPPDIHRVRNFGEDLYRMYLWKDMIACSIDEIDRATTVIFATIRSGRKSRRVLAEIEALIREHGFGGVARITIIPQE